MNGEHEVRLERIEELPRELHTKVGRLVEDGAVARTEIVWLKWGLRVLVAAVLGIGGATVGGMLT